MNLEQPFNPENWEKVISIEIGEKGQCERCRKLIESKNIGEHLFCESCLKYIWRLKMPKKKVDEEEDFDE